MKYDHKKKSLSKAIGFKDSNHVNRVLNNAIKKVYFQADKISQEIEMVAKMVDVDEELKRAIVLMFVSESHEQIDKTMGKK